MNVYESKGIIIKDKIAVLAVLLPKPVTNNEYTIANVYRHPTDNTILVHFKDRLGYALQIVQDNFETFILDLSNLPNFNGVGVIEVALYHENDQTDVEIRQRIEEIVRSARMGQCEMLSFVGEKKFLVPKTCGMGTIKPL